MEIIYKEQKCFSEAQLEQLFLSVGWEPKRRNHKRKTICS